MNFRWVAPAAADPGAVTACGPSLGLPPAVAEVLVRRGFSDPAAVKSFLRPHLGQLHPPESMLGMPRAVERILHAVQQREPVLVYGDYDVDGITSVAILVRVLRELGADVDWFIPHRGEHGYGLSTSGLRAATQKPVRLLISCDCGIGSVEQIRGASEVGIDVIVVDHHEPGRVLPPAFAVLNPKQPGCGYPERELAAVGVVFKLCQALYAAVGRSRRELYRYLDLVALGTIADLACALGENRVFMKFGLLQLERTENVGLRALLERTGLARRQLTGAAVSFVLAPRINAVGRMGSAAPGAELLLTEDAGEAALLAAILEEENKERREVDRATLEDARARVAAEGLEDRFTLVLGSPEWHAGVIGIVAARLVEEFHRPALLVALGGDGVGKGSGRSIPGFHLHGALEACSDDLLEYGGHAAAAGFRIEASRLPALQESFESHARRTLAPDDLVPEIRIDLDVEMLEDCASLYRLFQYFAPFGPGNARPVLSAREIDLVGEPRVVGEEHVRMRVGARGGTPLETIGFRMAARLPELDGSVERVSIAFTLEEDAFAGHGELQGKLLDFRIGP